MTDIEYARLWLENRAGGVAAYPETKKLCLIALNALEREQQIRDLLSKCTCMCKSINKVKELLRNAASVQPP